MVHEIEVMLLGETHKASCVKIPSNFSQLGGYLNNKFNIKPTLFKW